ncbi:MAG: class II fumarate hydratase [Deltaproteobacteria bacterium]|nr:MAG: class II fumarate hydratase [Deltaproteobacteria bacterium]
MPRIEHDSMGELAVPDDALWGASTQRAIDNFPISGQRFPRRFLQALGVIKRACAHANAEIGDLDRERADAIARAATELIDGALDAHFPLDIYQTGSGTSTNMNANEVLANRALQLLGKPLTARDVHPNDHVNMGQSSNDVIPTAMNVSGALAIHEDLLPALRGLAATLDAKAAAFMGIVKSGRTHLMDATPIQLGQEFSGYAAQVHHAVRRAEAARDALLELALGGTAVGTGINRHPDFPRLAIDRIAADTGLAFVEAANHFEAQAARDSVVEAHGLLATLAGSLFKIANDIRWLGSGPRAGFYEIRLPATQPGSSIMPGKVNPVMSEMLTMVAARVHGNQATIGLAGMSGNFELNVYLPVIAASLLESVDLLANGVATFDTRCAQGIEANREQCEASVEANLSIATALVPEIGYDAAAKLAKQAFATGENVRPLAKANGVDPERVDALLDPLAMTLPSPPGDT